MIKTELKINAVTEQHCIKYSQRKIKIIYFWKSKDVGALKMAKTQNHQIWMQRLDKPFVSTINEYMLATNTS